MISTLLLKLSGPLQSWGTGSRYSTRDTDEHPSKSGIIGLLSAALGRRRSDPVEDLTNMRFGVRIDQPGAKLRDFQTAIDWQTGKSQPLISRYYLSDAVFVAAVEGDDALIEGLAAAVRSPRFPLYLGRRSCPVGHDLILGVRQEPLETALASVPWQAENWHRRQRPSRVMLQVIRDAQPGEQGSVVRDVPVSFAPEKREYSLRTVVYDNPIEIENPLGTFSHDQFFETVIGS